MFEAAKRSQRAIEAAYAEQRGDPALGRTGRPKPTPKYGYQAITNSVLAVAWLLNGVFGHEDGDSDVARWLLPLAFALLGLVGAVQWRRHRHDDEIKQKK